MSLQEAFRSALQKLAAIEGQTTGYEYDPSAATGPVPWTQQAAAPAAPVRRAALHASHPGGEVMHPSSMMAGVRGTSGAIANNPSARAASFGMAPKPAAGNWFTRMFKGGSAVAAEAFLDELQKIAEELAFKSLPKPVLKNNPGFQSLVKKPQAPAPTQVIQGKTALGAAVTPGMTPPPQWRQALPQGPKRPAPAAPAPTPAEALPLRKPTMKLAELVARLSKVSAPVSYPNPLLGGGPTEVITSAAKGTSRALAGPSVFTSARSMPQPKPSPLSAPIISAPRVSG